MFFEIIRPWGHAGLLVEQPVCWAPSCWPLRLTYDHLVVHSQSFRLFDTTPPPKKNQKPALFSPLVKSQVGNKAL